MLILDKQKAVERMLALAAADPAMDPDEEFARLVRRSRQRVAVYERRTSAEASPQRRAERRAASLQRADGAPST
jgi:anti-sigma-K factor RskA